MQTNLHKGLFHSDTAIISYLFKKMQVKTETAIREHNGYIYISALV